MSYGVGRRCGSDPVLLRLWHGGGGKPKITPLPGEPQWAASAAKKKPPKKKKKKKRKWQIVTIKMVKINHLKSFALKHSSLL